MGEEKVTRRDFLKLATATTVGAVVGGVVGGTVGGYLAPSPPVTPVVLPAPIPPYMPARVPKPAPVPPGARVPIAISKFGENTPEAFDAALKSLIDSAGRDKFVELVSGKSVLIKCNWNDPVLFLCKEEEDNPAANLGAHTSPYLITAMAKAVRDAGARKVVLGESPAFATYTWCYENMVLRAKDYLKLPKEVEELKFLEKADFDNQKQYLVNVPNPYAQTKIVIPAAIREADVIISTSRLKTHFMGRVSLNLKQFVGAVPGSASSSGAGECKSWKDWQDLQKKFYDASMKDKKAMAGSFGKGRHHGTSVTKFRELAGAGLEVITEDGRKNAIMFPEYDMWLGAEISDNVEAVGGINFSVIGAECCLEGEGPLYTGPSGPFMSRPVDMKERVGSYLLIGGFDPVACDAVGARVQGWSAEELMAWPGIPQLHFASMKGLGTFDLNNIEVHGLGPTPVAATSIAVPNARFIKAERENFLWKAEWLPAYEKYGEPKILPELQA